MKMLKISAAAIALGVISTVALAAGHMSKDVVAHDQSVANVVVSADKIMAPANGWMVVHRTDATKKPGKVVGHAPLRAGENVDVAAILNEPVNAGEMLMLMVHSEAGGQYAGIFEYTLGAKEDGPIKRDGKLVMQIITAK
jgi:hypothetical protein